jgi:UPF0716 protein FxsA
VVVLALLIVVPIVEIAVAIQVAHHIGGVDTILLLIGLSLGGAWLAKQAGFGVLARMRDQVERGVLPGNEIIDAVLVLIAGILLLVPGFVTGAIGLVLLIPPVRHAVRGMVKRSLRRRAYRYRIGPGGPPLGGPTGTGDVIDV